MQMDGLLPGPGALISLPLPLSGSSSDGAKPLLKSTSLSRLEELEQYLKQCDDPHHMRKYYKMLSSCPSDVLDDYAKQLKNRAVWLATEEQREYKRAKLLNVMGEPLVPISSADADAFCTKVLEDHYPEEACVTPHAGKPPSARWQQARPTPQQPLPMQQHQPQQPQQQQQHGPVATGSSKRQRQEGEDEERQQPQQLHQPQLLQQPPSAGSPYAAAAAMGPLSPAMQALAALFSPAAHISVIDHHPRISPLPLPLELQLAGAGSGGGGSREGAQVQLLQTQLEPKQ